MSGIATGEKGDTLPIRMEREYIVGVNHHEMVKLTAARYIGV